MGAIKFWEINGNLDDSQTGLPNYLNFERVIARIKTFYDDIFGKERMNRVPFYVDNATAGSGYTPISTPVLKRLVIIKLGIEAADSNAKIAYQFSHELTHVVFRAYFGIDKPCATDEEEAICSAASLIVLKAFCPNDFEWYNRHVESLSNTPYRMGATIAKEISYDMHRLREKIESFTYEQNTANQNGMSTSGS